MKVTWFARTCFRLHIGGKILVIDPETAPAGIDAQELVSGADRVVRLGQPDLPVFDPQKYRPIRRRSLIAEYEGDEIAVCTHGERSLVIAATDEPLVILAPYETAKWGRFADDALVVFHADRIADAEAFSALVEAGRPRLVALASNAATDDIFTAIANAGDGLAVQVLDPALALEV